MIRIPNMKSAFNKKDAQANTSAIISSSDYKNSALRMSEIANSRDTKHQSDFFFMGSPTLDFYDVNVPAAVKSSNQNSKHRIISQKNQYWEKSKSPWWFAPLFSVLTTLYLAVSFSAVKVRKTSDIGFFVFFSLLLILLPFFNPNCFKWKSVFLALSATTMLISCIVIEFLVGRQQCMVVYFGMAITFRVLHQKTVFDNFALCLAYSSDVIAINSNAQTWFFTSKVLLWGCFGLAVFMYSLFRRTSYRIWELVRLLVIFREKSKQETHLADVTIKAHFPADLVDIVFPEEGDPHIFTTASAPRTSNSICEERLVIKSAITKGIISGFVESSLNLDQIRSLDGVDRRPSVVIAIKQEIGDDRECDLTSIGGYAVHDLFDTIAKRNDITSVRKFGDVWVGCRGFTDTKGQSSADCLNVIKMASEVLSLAEELHLRVCCAIDCGNIIGGFVGSMHFDLFGPEVRWVLSMVEAKKIGSILVNQSVKQKIAGAQKKDQNQQLQHVKFDSINLQPIWRSRSVEKVYQVSNPFSLCKISLNDVFPEISHIKNRNHKSTPINWLTSQKTTFDDRENFTDFTVNSGMAGRHFVKDSERGYFHTLMASFYSATANFFGKCSIDHELGTEFQSSVSERHKVSLVDSALEEFADDDLLDVHNELVKAIYELISEICLNNYWRMFFLVSSIDDSAVVDSDITSPADYSADIPAVEDDDFLSVSPWSMFSSFLENDMVYLSLLADISCRIPVPNFIRHMFVTSHYSAYASKVIPVEVDQDDTESSQNIFSGETLYKGDKNMKHTSRAAFQTDTVENTTTYSDEKCMKTITEGEILPPITASKLEVPTLDGDLASESVDPILSEPELQRSWPKYSRDMRVFFHNRILVFMVYFLFIVCTSYIVVVSYPDETIASSSRFLDPFLVLFYIQLIVPIIFERRYDNIIFPFLLVIRCTYILLIPTSSFCNSIVYTYSVDGERPIGRSLIFDSFGDFGGECKVLLLVFYWNAMAVRQSFSFVILDQIVTIAAIYYQTFQNCSLSLASFLMVIIFSIFRVTIFWLIEYQVFFAYILEHKLLPEGKENYRKQIINSRSILRQCTPHIPERIARELYCPRRYRNCAIVAIHVKAADLLPGMLDPKDVKVFLHQIFRIIDSCIIECGMLKVTQFSGLFIAAACKDLSWDTNEGSRASITHITRAVTLMRTIQKKIDHFNEQGNFHVTTGVGINQGSVSIGFLGNNRYCFDMAGNARDITCAMSTFQNDGSIYASEVFSTEFEKKGRFSDDLVTRRISVISGTREMVWLKIDGSLSGIDLINFEYICMLGRGGYGSVHLLRENTTGIKYAIKAIPRKQGSAISKNIQREFLILQQMQHENVVKFEYCIILKNRIYLVMQYVRGGNLKQIVERDKPNLGLLRFWFAELVLALDYVHSLGIIHRDVKPANCMIGADGHLKLADFGLSKIVAAKHRHEYDMDEGGMRTKDGIIAAESLQAIRNLLPLKPKMNNGDVLFKEKDMQILLIDIDDAKDSKNRISLWGMYCIVTVVKTIQEAEILLSQENCKFELVLFDIDGFLSSSNSENFTFSSLIETKSEYKIETRVNYFSVLRHLCKGDTFHRIPVVVLSLDESRHIIKYCIDAGAKDVVMKPMPDSYRSEMLKYVREYRNQKPEELERMTEFSRGSSSILYNQTGTTSTTSSATDAAMDLRRGSLSIIERLGGEVTSGRHHLSATNHNEVIGNLDNIYRPSDNTTAVTAGDNDTGFNVQTDKSLDATATLQPKAVEVHSAVGTLHFLSPEVISRKEYDKSVDWWACGITFYFCTLREYVFQGGDKDEIMKKILSAPIDLNALTELSPLFESLMKGLLDRNPATRLGTSGAQKIKHHDFFYGIDWFKLSESDAPFKPAQDITQKHDGNDKLLFYGDLELEQRLEKSSSGSRSGKLSSRSGKLSSASHLSQKTSTSSGRKKSNKSKLFVKNELKSPKVRLSWMTAMIDPKSHTNERRKDGSSNGSSKRIGSLDNSKSFNIGNSGKMTIERVIEEDENSASSDLSEKAADNGNDGGVNIHEHVASINDDESADDYDPHSLLQQSFAMSDLHNSLSLSGGEGEGKDDE